MKNLKFILPFFLLGLFLAGCSIDEGPLPSDVEPMAQEESALKGAKKISYPFLSEFILYGEGATKPNGKLFINDGNLFHQKVYGDGTVLFQGQELEAELLIADEKIHMQKVGTEMISTTSNVKVELTIVGGEHDGDKLFFNYSSVIDASPMFTSVDGTGAIVVTDAHGIILGGTGIFDKAKGTITYEGVWPFSEWGMVFEPGICTFNGAVLLK